MNIRGNNAHLLEITLVSPDFLKGRPMVSMRSTCAALFLVSIVALGCNPPAIRQAASQPSTDAVILAYGPLHEWPSALERLAKEGNASREVFEAFLTAYRRDDSESLIIGLETMGAVEYWGKRHKGRLDFLRPDSESWGEDRRILAKAALGIWADDGNQQRVPCSVVTFNIPVLLTAVGVGDTPKRLAEVLPLKEDLVADLLSRSARLPVHKKISLSYVLGLIEKTGGLKPVMFPEPYDSNQEVYEWEAHYPERKSNLFSLGHLCNIVCIIAGMMEKNPDGGGYQHRLVIFTTKRILFIAIP